MNGLVLVDLNMNEYQQTVLYQDSQKGEAEIEENYSKILSQTEAIEYLCL